jgi:CRISPR-associated protein Csb2
MGKQAYDVQLEGAGEASTALRRFGRALDTGRWPFDEVLTMAAEGGLEQRLLAPETRVAFCVAVHRAIVRALRSDVPALVTGRDGSGPLRGAGHLALQLVRRADGSVALALAMPAEAADADRAVLAEALEGGLRVPFGRSTTAFQAPATQAALPFWHGAGGPLRSAVPIALDTTGAPRRGSWSLDDALLCSLAYAMRGVLERDGVTWSTGWDFRRHLVDVLRTRYGARAQARRVAAPASRYVHRTRPGDLAVAVDGALDLGELASEPGGFLALGRARHLGGGLLVPSDVLA